MIDYERLEVYKPALDFVRETVPLRAALSKVKREFTDLLRRASFSMVLNIAEGAERVQAPDKRMIICARSPGRYPTTLRVGTNLARARSML